MATHTHHDEPSSVLSGSHPVLHPPLAPVFVDVTGRRHRLVRRWGLLVASGSLAYLPIVALAALTGPAVPIGGTPHLDAAPTMEIGDQPPALPGAVVALPIAPPAEPAGVEDAPGPEGRSVANPPSHGEPDADTLVPPAPVVVGPMPTPLPAPGLTSAPPPPRPTGEPTDTPSPTAPPPTPDPAVTSTPSPENWTGSVVTGTTLTAFTAR
ncbi:hypothetical protein [Micromonospora sp. NPDC049497]|uniref:hypothetical protein n=1 Tax=Micromonospora sp. NPDC049497 TaxID=3364273 RepID=UPI003799ED3F